MARVELIPQMTEEQLDTNENYARERIENNPEQTFWAKQIELIQVQRQYNNDAISDQDYERQWDTLYQEYLEIVREELPNPQQPHR